jgi:hypothetical protein
MKLAACLVSLAALGCQAVAADPQPAPSTALDATTAVLANIEVGGLTLMPIISTAPVTAQVDVLTLDEAFDQKLVTIKEQPSESVNALTLTNASKLPLFLLAGEVIIGGKQDRIIGQNTIITAKSTQRVPVFCVEHGRWDAAAAGGSAQFTSARALAHGRLRGQASYEDQAKVWNEVSAKNAARKTTNSTDTYRRVAQQQTDASNADIERALAQGLDRLDAATRGRVIGFAVALNGKVSTLDVFDSPALLGKLQRKLLRSYASDARDLPMDRTAKRPSAADLKSFIADADKATTEKSYDNPAAATVRQKGAKADKSSVNFKDAGYSEADAMKPSPAKKPVYKNYQAK